MKIKIVAMIGMFLVGLCHPQHVAAQDRTKKLEESLTVLAKALGIPDDKVKLNTSADIAKTTDSVVKLVQTLQAQNARKTKALEDLATTLTAQYCGLVADNMNDLSDKNRKLLNNKIGAIKEDLDRVVILEMTIKDREGTIKKKLDEIADKDVDIQLKKAQLADLDSKNKEMKKRLETMQNFIDSISVK